MSRRLKGFVLTGTLRGIIFGVLVLGFVAAVSTRSCGCGPASKQLHAKTILHNLDIALQVYQLDFGAYPPDDFHCGSGSEILFHYLGTELPAGSKRIGPYMEFAPEQLKEIPGSPNKKVISPFGGDYSYIVRTDANGQPNGYLLIDPGKDRELGGRLDREKGLIVDDPQKAADNLTVPEK
ncbi:MAG TPA: hypothetical protein VKX17_12785 [Planctomycetota bacterium]|nr:hypothetical protein [Planctomycetota bacterium]